MNISGQQQGPEYWNLGMTSVWEWMLAEKHARVQAGGVLDRQCDARPTVTSVIFVLIYFLVLVSVFQLF